MSSPAEYYHSLPPICKAYGTLCVAVTTACSLRLLDPSILALEYKLVFSYFQVWRLMTNFFFLGSFSINFWIRLLMIAYGVNLEKGPFEMRTSDFLWMMIFGALSLLTFYLHNVAYNCIPPDRTITPVAYWNESMVKRFMKWLRPQGGIGSDKIRMRTVDTTGPSRLKVVRHPNFEEIIQKQILAIRVLTFKLDNLADAISDQTEMIKKLLHQRQTMDHVASHVHHPTTDYIKTPSHEFLSTQEDNIGAEFIEISSNEGSKRGCDKINSPYGSSILNTKERQLHEMLSALEMALGCERTATYRNLICM